MLNFNKLAQEQAKQESSNALNRWAIPVGTSTVLEKKRFKLDQRDVSCTLCTNGLKCIVTREVQGKRCPVEVFCVCVPYVRSEDAEGNQVVIYKGRAENWPKGVRSEQAIQDELMRKQAAIAAINRREDIRAGAHSNANVGGKYQLGKLSADELKATGLTAGELNALVPKVEGEAAAVRAETTAAATPAPAVNRGPVVSRGANGTLQYNPPPKATPAPKAESAQDGIIEL